MRPVNSRLQLTGLNDLKKIATVAQEWMQSAAETINAIVQGERAQFATRSILTAITADFADCIIEVDATAGAVTVTLPLLNTITKVPAGKFYRVMKTDASANAVTVSANTGQTINGTSTITLATQYSMADITVPASGTNFRRWIF